MPSVLRPMLAAATVLLVAGVAAVAVWVDVRAAAFVLAGGLAVAALLRMLLPERHLPVGRGRPFDVTVLLVLAVATALLAPWGLATTP